MEEWPKGGEIVHAWHRREQQGEGVPDGQE